MLRNYREGGFFLIDILLSITILMVIMSSILPMIMYVEKHIVRERQNINGSHLLYETAHHYLLYGRKETGLMERDGYPFEIRWYEEGGKKRLCVMYEDAFQQLVEKCEFIY